MNLKTESKTQTETLKAFYLGQVFLDAEKNRPLSRKNFQIGDKIIFSGKKLRFEHRVTNTYKIS
jgi:hypothetical protein